MNPLLLNVPKLYYILISESIPPAPHPLSSLWFFILKLVLLCIYFYLSIYLKIRSHYVTLTGLWLPVWICLELTRERLASSSQVRGLKVCATMLASRLFYTCVHMCAGMYMPWYIDGGQRITGWSHFSPSITGAPGVTLGLSVLEQVSLPTG